MTKARLNARSFENLADRRGRNVLWEQAEKCTCWSGTSGQPSYDCKACDGFGYLYNAPVECRGTIVVNIALNKEFTQLGEYRMGDCIATVPAHNRDFINGKVEYTPNPFFDVGDFDRVTLLDSEFRSHETLIRGEPMYTRQPDALRNPEVTRILSILKADPQTGEVTRYRPQIDYILRGNLVDWVGNSPMYGEKYSVLYYHRPIYVVYTQLPQPRDQDEQNLPKKVVLRYRDAL